MILTRLGNKRKIAASITQYFPPHTTYVEPFFGAGGVFFNKPKAKYNILNDIDSDVFNLFMVVKKHKKQLEKSVFNMPVHEELLRYWQKNKEVDPVQKALRFLFLSNFGYMGKPHTLRFGVYDGKSVILKNIETTNRLLSDCQFMNCDFRKVIKKMAIKPEEKATTFIYADPPYLGTENNFQCGFNEVDSFDLFELLQNSDIKFAISEEAHPFILDQAKKRGLLTINIGERQSLKKRSVEILITNYRQSQIQIF